MSGETMWDSEGGPWGPPRRPGRRAAAKRWLIRASAALRRVNASRGGFVLAYHATPESRTHAWWIDFRAQMQLLEDVGCAVVPLETLAREPISPSGAGPRVALTFDDAWADNLRVAFPELARRRWPASVFVPTGLVGRAPFCTREQLTELASFGVSVENHTHRHPDLTTLDDAAIAGEVEACSSRLFDWTGRRPAHFCYPFGRHDRRVRDAIARTGLSVACTGIPGVNRPGGDPFLLRRLTLDAGMGPRELRAALAGGQDWLARRIVARSTR